MMPIQPQEDRVLRTEDRAVQNLIYVLKRIRNEPWSECSNVVERYKTSIKSALERKTQLSLPKYHKMTIEVSSYVPDSICKILNSIPEIYLWLLARDRDLSQMSGTLKEIIQREPELISLSGARVSSGSTQLTRELTDKMLKIMHDFFERLLYEFSNAYKGDVLGYYDIGTSTVTLNWVVIFLTARCLGVSVVPLAYVVLTHELAHMYTHLGQDTVEDRWDTRHFEQLNPLICEGLAQWYTFEICRQCGTVNDWLWLADNPLIAFSKLLDHQSEPYQVYQKWVPEHKKNAEV